MAIFKPYKITSSQLETLPITEGQFIVTTDTNKIYLDESASNRIELIPVPTKTSDLVNDMNFMSGMTILKYGISTWNDFITAYTAKHVVYTRASSGSNPASGSQTRMAFMAYVNNETNPTEVEFQYYRSVSTHSDSQQGDQTYIYKLNKTNGWSVTVRENYTKVVAGTGMSSTWSGGKITLNCTVTPPTKTSDLTNDSGFIDNTVNNLTNYTKTSDLADVALTGDYDDLTNKPTIPTVNNATLTIQKNGTTVNTFSANADTNVTANIEVPTKTSDLTNDSGYTTNTGTITGVSVNGTSVATSGVANIASVPASILTGAIPSAVTATTQTQGDNSTKIATTAYVDTAVDNLPEPMVFKGSLGTGGTITTLPVDGSANIGDTYKVITAGTYASKSADVGDIFICLTKTSSANTWELIPSGDEPNGTVTSVTLNATSPIAIDNNTAITTSGTRTISHATSGVTAGTYKSVTVNATGHVTAGTNPTTISGYGITDAKIDNGVITLGNNTITPLTTSYDYIIPSIDVYPSESLTGTITDSNVISVLSDIHSNARHNTLRIGLWIYDESDGTSHFATNISYEDTTQPLTFMYTYGITYIVTISYSGSQPTATYTIQKIEDATDTKNTAGTTNTTDKIYLAGGKSQGDNPQTYSNVNCYASGGKLYSNAKEVVNLSDSQALTNKTYNGYTLAAASAKAVDTSISAASTSTNLPTSQAVASFVEGKGYITSEVNSNLVNGSATGSLRTVSSAEESTNYTIGKNAFAQGMSTEASGLDSFAQGMYAKASGQDSFAQGRFTNASARGSHAEGESTTASGQGAHAEGYTTTASGAYSHAEGSSAHSVGDYSHAEGNFTWANGNYSHAEGYYAKASSQYQHVEGKFNVEDSNDTYAHIVGGGTSNSQKNIHTLTWAGEAWFSGDVYTGSTSGTNKDAGSQKLATETLVNTKQNQILSGTTDPSNSLGVNGDVYIKYSA